MWAQKQAGERDWGTERGEREAVSVRSMHTSRPTATRGTSVPITSGASLTCSELTQEVEKFQKGKRGKLNGIGKLYLSVPRCWIVRLTDIDRSERYSGLTATFAADFSWVFCCSNLYVRAHVFLCWLLHTYFASLSLSCARVVSLPHNRLSCRCESMLLRSDTC